MRKYFLNPYIGDKYEEGINGKRVLVLGASFYCSLDGNKGRKRCEYYEDCAINQNSIKYNEICPHNNGRLLSDSAEGEIDENGATSYIRFCNFMRWVRSKFTTESFNEFWNKVAFTNYVQHMIGGRTTTSPSDVREEYFEMFVSVLDEFEKNDELPNVVIVWGCVIDKPLKNNDIPGHGAGTVHGARCGSRHCPHPGRFARHSIGGRYLKERSARKDAPVCPAPRQYSGAR